MPRVNVRLAVKNNIDEGAKMKRVSDIEFNSKIFQQWWARHPWTLVSVNDSKPVLHKNIILVSVAVLLGTFAGGMALVGDVCKWADQYQNDKKVLTETELNDKYSKAKLARYAVYNKWQKQMSTKEK